MPGYEKINEFFKLVLEEKIKLPITHFDVEKRVRFLWGDETNGCPLPQGAYSDEMTHMLMYKQNVIALVIETRTAFNYVHFDFFENFKTLERIFKEEEHSRLEEKRFFDEYQV